MKVFQNWVLVALALCSSGCQPKATESSAASKTPIASSILVSVEPTGAVPVGDARDNSENGQEITLVGLIGGSSQPFVEGLAAFTIVDPKVPYCAAEEGCPTPWDYCCQTEAVKDNIATVKMLDDSGRPFSQSAREILNVTELSTVVVKGKALRDDKGNLTIAASQIFVRPGK